MSYRPYIKTTIASGDTIDLKDLPESTKHILFKGETISIVHNYSSATTANEIVEYTIDEDIGNARYDSTDESWSSDSNGEIPSLKLTSNLTFTATAGDPVNVPSRRDITPGMRTAIGQESSTITHFIEAQFSDTSLLLNTATHDIKMMNPDLMKKPNADEIPAINGEWSSGNHDTHHLATKWWREEMLLFHDGDQFYVEGDNTTFTIDTSEDDFMIFDCENKTLWQEFSEYSSDITKANDGDSQEGTYSTKITIGANTIVRNDEIVYLEKENFDTAGNTDLSSYDGIKFWFKANQDLRAGDIMFVLSRKKTLGDIKDWYPIINENNANGEYNSSNGWIQIEHEFENPDILDKIKSIGFVYYSEYQNSSDLEFNVDAIKVFRNKVKSDSNGKADIPVSNTLSSGHSVFSGNNADEKKILRLWSGAGGLLSFNQVSESKDLKGNNVEVQMSAVDPTVVLSPLLSQNYIGRMIKIYRGHFDNTTKLIINHPIIMHIGYMNGGFEITEERSEEIDGATENTATITATVQDVISARDRVIGIQTNLESHQIHAPDDEFFSEVPSLVDKQVVWGVPETTDPGGGMCMLATSCLKYMGLDDNCEELRTLRKFRDEYLKNTKKGRELIYDYYSVTESLTNYVAGKSDKHEEYKRIYGHVQNAVKAIKDNRPKDAIEEYYKIINPLKKEYVRGEK